MKKNNRYYGLHRIFIILSTFLLLNFISIPINAQSFTCDVTITLDQHSVVYYIEPNASCVVTVSGNVTCEMEGSGIEILRVEVNLHAGDERKWSPKISPEYMTFHSSGSKMFNISINIPDTEYNETENNIYVQGNWITEPYDSKHVGGQGEVNPDQFHVMVYRTYPLRGIIEVTPMYEEHKTFWEELDFRIKIALFLIPPIIIISIIIVVLYKRKKKIDEYMY